MESEINNMKTKMNLVIDQVNSLVTDSGKIQDSLKNIDSVMVTKFNDMVKEHNSERDHIERSRERRS